MKKNSTSNALFILILVFISHLGIAQCPDLTIACIADIFVSLDATGSATLTPEDVTGFPLDPTATYVVEPNTFTCADVGTIILYTFSVTCPGGGTNQCWGNITVEDKIAPIISCPDPITLALDEEGEVEYNPPFSVDDNCPGEIVSLSITYDCSQLGFNSDTIVIFDAGGNSDFCAIQATIIDNHLPTPICNSSVTGDLMGLPSYNLDPADVDAGSFDNCDLLFFQLSQADFTADDIGANTVDMYVIDGSGNEDFCTFTFNLVNSVVAGSSGSNTSFEYIKKVRLRQINNRSNDDGGYGDYTGLSTRLRTGRSYNLKLRPGFNGTSYVENWNVWIDWNQNNVYEAPELIYSGSSSGNIASSITVPTDALNGLTNMRVSMKWGSFAAPDETFLYGEVEDYTIDVRGGIIPLTAADESDLALTAIDLDKTFTIYPVPASNTINVKGHRAEDKLLMYNINGQLVRALDSKTSQHDISDLQNQSYYIILRRENGEQEVRKFIKMN